MDTGPIPSIERGKISFANMLELSDEQVMCELQAGNTDAFAIVFSRYHKLVHLIALRILVDAGEAEDLSQSVFLEIYRKMGQYDPAKGTLKVWLLQYVYSRSTNRLNYLRVRQFRQQAELGEVGENESLFSSCPPRPEMRILSTEILALLPMEQRETIELYFFEGLTLKEIAESRKETFYNARHHYYRGLDRLRELLKSGGPCPGSGEPLPSGEGV